MQSTTCTFSMSRSRVYNWEKFPDEFPLCYGTMPQITTTAVNSQLGKLMQNCVYSLKPSAGYVNGSVTREQSGWRFTIKQLGRSIQEV